MTRLRVPLAAAALAAALCFGGTAARAQDCMTVMSQIPDLSTFVGSLNRTGVANLLRGPGPYTVLAPTNEAINKTPVNIRNDLMGSQPTQDIDPIRAPAVLNAHIIDGKHMASEVRGQERVTMRTRNGNELIIQRQSDGHYTLTPGAGGFGAGGRSQIPPARAVRVDIPCSNGVVHIVDNVLVR
ncbi:MAG: fasciclin domain-containing protein [Acetobacteraceae bacterium]|nr:fasciclin domain-containing protein [Acetobacteraceae bacterium]MDI3308956.1 fasciclin domain-containing protein [Acetobacteraceae bacterium]